VNHWGRDFAVRKEWLPIHDGLRNENRESILRKLFVTNMIREFDKNLNHISSPANFDLGLTEICSTPSRHRSREKS